MDIGVMEVIGFLFLSYQTILSYLFVYISEYQNTLPVFRLHIRNITGPGNYIQAYIFCTSDLPPLPTFTDGCENFGQDAGNGQCYQV